MKDIEDAKGQHDMGVMAARVFQGALEELDYNTLLAFFATAAFFAGMFKGNREGEEGGDS